MASKHSVWKGQQFKCLRLAASDFSDIYENAVLRGESLLHYQAAPASAVAQEEEWRLSAAQVNMTDKIDYQVITIMYCKSRT